MKHYNYRSRRWGWNKPNGDPDMRYALLGLMIICPIAAPILIFPFLYMCYKPYLHEGGSKELKRDLAIKKDIQEKRKQRAVELAQEQQRMLDRRYKLIEKERRMKEMGFVKPTWKEESSFKMKLSKERSAVIEKWKSVDPLYWQNKQYIAEMEELEKWQDKMEKEFYSYREVEAGINAELGL